MITSGITPLPHYEKKCDTCSFYNLCLPKTIEKQTEVATWLEKIVHKEQVG